MAIIYFVRDGYGEDNRTLEFSSISSNIAEQLFKTFRFSYEPEKMYFDAHLPVNPVSELRHVVIKIEQHDLCTKFPNEGLYLIENLTPKRCREIVSQQSSTNQ